MISQSAVSLSARDSRLLSQLSCVLGAIVQIYTLADSSTSLISSWKMFTTLLVMNAEFVLDTVTDNAVHSDSTEIVAGFWLRRKGQLVRDPRDVM